MDSGQYLIELAILIILLLVPMGFGIGIFWAIFSPELRKHMRKRWWLYIIWFVVSIMIIGVLFPVSPGGIQVAKEAKTRAGISQIQTALLAYQTEYDKFPPGKDNATIIRELMSDSPRQIAFLNLKPADMNAKGEALDAWSTPLRISLTDAQAPVIQSAGPDKKWNTPDDITRQSEASPSGR